MGLPVFSGAGRTKRREGDGVTSPLPPRSAPLGYSEGPGSPTHSLGFTWEAPAPSTRGDGVV